MCILCEHHPEIDVKQIHSHLQDTHQVSQSKCPICKNDKIYTSMESLRVHISKNHIVKMQKHENSHHQQILNSPPDISLDLEDSCSQLFNLSDNSITEINAMHSFDSIPPDIPQQSNSIESNSKF